MKTKPNGKKTDVRGLERTRQSILKMGKCCDDFAVAALIMNVVLGKFIEELEPKMKGKIRYPRSY